MADKITKIVLSLILTVAILLGAYLGWQRHMIESESKTVELAIDYNDLKTISAASHYPFDKLLNEVKQRGIVSIGLREETLPEANVLGEVYYISGSAIFRSPQLNQRLANLKNRKLISKDKVYILSTNPAVRKRILLQLNLLLPKEQVTTLGPDVIVINEGEIALRDAGMGMSEVAHNYLTKKGFNIIPRVWNDIRYDVKGKIKSLAGHELIIFDGDEILGYPDQLRILAKALKKNNIKYGNIEIIKQGGDQKLKALMGNRVVRVHGIAKDEVKKMDKEEAITRFVRAAKERSIRLIYIRPFMAPQVSEESYASYNLQYLSEIKTNLESAGFTIGRASSIKKLEPFGWELMLLGFGVVTGFLLLFDYFLYIPWEIKLLSIIISAFVMVFIGVQSSTYLLEKGLAWLAAVVFPSYAIISQFSKEKTPTGNQYLDAVYIVFNVLVDTVLGIFLIVGLLSNTAFMMGAQSFEGVKFALILPIFIIAFYFFFKTDKGFNMKSFKERSGTILKANIPVWIIIGGIFAIAMLGILLARSGNFILSVPGIEKEARLILEKIMAIRPRTKEFLIGYPALIIAAFLYLKGIKKWNPIILPVAAIGTTSLLNTFCHVHTPIYVSLVRSINGLFIGIIVGSIAWWVVKRYIKEK